MKVHDADLLAALFQHHPGGLALLDGPPFRVLSANPVFSGMLQAGAPENRLLDEVWPDFPALRQLHEALAGGAPTVRAHEATLGGEPGFIVVHAVPLPEPDVGASMLVIVCRSSAPGRAVVTAPAPSQPVVLVVDDDDELRQSLCAVLEEEGCRCVQAHDGRVAMQLLETESPVLMMLDLRMPLMDGWEVLRALEQHARWSTLPVVVCAACSREQARLPDGRIAAYLEKPVRYEDLVVTVRPFLRLV